jgi:hypothetical protein
MNSTLKIIAIWLFVATFAVTCAMLGLLVTHSHASAPPTTDLPAGWLRADPSFVQQFAAVKKSYSELQDRVPQGLVYGEKMQAFCPATAVVNGVCMPPSPPPPASPTGTPAAAASPAPPQPAAPAPPVKK